MTNFFDMTTEEIQQVEKLRKKESYEQIDYIQEQLAQILATLRRIEEKL